MYSTFKETSLLTLESKITPRVLRTGAESMIRITNFATESTAGFNIELITHKGVNYCSKYTTQVLQQRHESPAVTLTWYACKYKVL